MSTPRRSSRLVTKAEPTEQSVSTSNARRQSSITDFLSRAKASTPRQAAKDVSTSSSPITAVVNGGKGRRLSLSPTTASQTKKSVKSIFLQTLLNEPSAEASLREQFVKVETSRDEPSHTFGTIIEPPPKIIDGTGDVTASVNELHRRAAVSGDASLSTWIEERRDMLAASTASREVEGAEEEDAPPPLEDVVAPVFLAKPAPALQTSQALLIAAKLDIPRSALRLPLPPSLMFLQAFVNNLDHVVSLAASRAQPAIFHKLARPLENILGRRVTTDHLTQVRVVWPEAYTLEPCRVVHDGKRVSSFRLSIGGHTHLSERKVLFQWQAVQFVHMRHAELLHQLGIAVPSIADLTSWHVKFDLEKLIVPTEECTMAASVEVKTPESMPNIAKTPTKPVMAVPSSTLSLLERVRAKQQRAEAEKILQKPRQEQARAKALEDLVDRIILTFASQRKNGLLLKELVERAKVPVQDIEELSRLAPDWLQIMHSDDVAKRGELVVRIDRTIPARAVKARLFMRERFC